MNLEDSERGKRVMPRTRRSIQGWIVSDKPFQSNKGCMVLVNWDCGSIVKCYLHDLQEVF